MRGLGTDEAAMIKVLGHRNIAEIAAIKAAYAQKHGKDLIHAVKSELSGNFGKAMVGLLKDPRQYDSDALHDAMKGAGTDEYTLISILVGRSNEQIAQIGAIYTRDHKRSLESSIRAETTGDLQRFMIDLVAPRDPEFTVVSEDAARNDAERLYKAGEGKIGTDEKVFVELFTRRSFTHLKRVFAIYETIHKHHTMDAAVESEFSGALKTGLLGVVTYTRNPGEYYADVARRAMKGLGTDEDMLTRVIVGNRDRLAETKAAYSAKYKKSLYSAVESETSGDYKKTLLALIGN